MICSELTPQQMKRSQWNFLKYNFANGIGYCCVGDTVMMLLANRLNFPDWVLTTLTYLFGMGYIWLPLGKYCTGKWGAARTQSNFWFLRNIAAVLMSSCAIWGLFDYKGTAAAFLLGGAFLFYGCRAAGATMSTALVGNITTPEGRGKLLSYASMAHNITSAIASITLTVLLAYSKSLWVLYGIVIFGAFCGITSAIFLRNIDETDAIAKAARKPLLKDALNCLKKTVFLRLLLGKTCASVGLALTIGLNIIILKRGLGIPDSIILAFNFVGGFINSLLARSASIVGDKFGPKIAVVQGYCVSFLIIAFWYCVPDQLPIGADCTLKQNIIAWAVLLILQVITSYCSLCSGICQGQYFLKAIPVEDQPTALVVDSLCSGFLTGFICVGISALLWQGCDHYIGSEITGMVRYRFFLKLALPVVALCGIGVACQKKV